MLESKEDMRRRGALSPDEWDAVALTFARPVAPNNNFHRKLVYPRIGGLHDEMKFVPKKPSCSQPRAAEHTGFHASGKCSNGLAQERHHSGGPT